jgi:putative glutamine amidotransferase
MADPRDPDTATPAGPRRPVVGVCAVLERARWSVWDMDAALVPHNYIQAVQRAGGIAVLVPPDAAVAEDPDAVLDLVDGLMLVGGPDVDPSRYGAERHPFTEQPVPIRDEVEIALSRRAAARGIPVLGICRGMQVLNVAAGGTLRQHLPDEPGMADHRRSLGSFDGADHEVRLEDGSRALAAAGGSPHRIKSHHHQGVEEVGEGLRVTGWATDDGLAEAIEGEGPDYRLGVQWHPEADPESGLIGSLVAAAAEARARRESAAAPSRR